METREYTSLAGGVWSSINHAINDSQHTVKALGAVLQGLGTADKASKSFRKLLKQIKLKLHASDISSVKDRIHTHTTSLQLALQMLSVFLGCLCSENALNVINPKLDDIGPKVGNLIAMVANLDVSQPKPRETQLPDTFQNPEILGHTEELARSIKAVLTAASSVAGLSSSRWGGSESNFLYFSEYGELLDETWKTRMEQWIPPPMLEEEPDISMVVNASTELSGVATPTEDEFLQDDDLDDEVDLEIVQRLIESGSESFAQQRYAEAVECYRAGIDRAKRLSQAKISSLELENGASKMASSEANIEFGLVQRVFQEAQQTFVEGDYCEAADMFRNDRQNHFDEEIDGRIGNLVTIGLDTASSRALVTNYHAKCASDILRRLDMDISAEEFDKDEALLRLIGLQPGLGLYSSSNITFTARILLDRGANANAKDSEYGAAALIRASDRGHRDIVQLLCERDADVNARSKDGTTALHVSAVRGHIAVVELLLRQGANIEATDGGTGDTPLMKAARFGQNLIAVILLQAGAIVSRTNHKRATALMVAATHGQEGVARILLDSGADLETQDNHGITPLFTAATWDNAEVVKMLLAAGAKIETRNVQTGGTPLMEAAQFGNRACIEILLEGGANVDAQNDKGNTIIMEVISPNHVKDCMCNLCSELTVKSDLIRVLVLRGANLSLKDKQGNSAIDVAKKYEGVDKADIISVLREAGQDCESQPDAKTVEAGLRHGVSSTSSLEPIPGAT